MAFSVNKPLNPDYPLTNVPATLRPPIVPLETTLPARKLILFEAEDEYDRLKPMLGTVEEGVLEWDDPRVKECDSAMHITLRYQIW